MIHTQRDPSGKLTTHTVEGHVTIEDIRKVIEGFHVGHPTLNVLWDFRQAEATHISASEMERLVDDVRQHARIREGGKTALVFSGDLWFGQGRMFQAYAELQDAPVSFSCFRSIEAALNWLNVDPTS